VSNYDFSRVKLVKIVIKEQNVKIVESISKEERRIHELTMQAVSVDITGDVTLDILLPKSQEIY
jgi:hypothetical protein